MAGKRGATSDLNHDNWDRDDEVEDAGTFRKASDEVLKKRVIKQARRRGPIASNPVDGAEKKNIFGGFTGFNKAPANPTAVFSFIKKEENGTEGKKVEENGEYLGKLKGLNESVLVWIKKHVEENPFIDLKPVFVDYDRYFKEIEIEKVSVEQKKELSGFSFKKTEEVKKVPEFSFGPPKKAEFSFGDKKEGFGFGKVETEKFVFSKSGEGFKNVPSNQSLTNVTSFSSPALSTVQNPQTSSVSESCQEGKEDEDEPPKVEFTPVVEEDNIYTIRCKVFVKKDGSFKDRGVGNLFLKPIAATGKVQLIVRADTNLGNLLLNFVLSEGIPMQRLGKKDVMVCCLPMPDCQPPPVPVLLRVKSGDEADTLLETLEKHKK